MAIIYLLEQIRNTKSEIRNKSEYRNAENSKRVWIILVSDFGILAYFDIRASNFTALFKKYSQRRQKSRR